MLSQLTPEFYKARSEAIEDNFQRALKVVYQWDQIEQAITDGIKNKSAHNLSRKEEVPTQVPARIGPIRLKQAVKEDMNIGVYVAAGPNPIFLRIFLLQIARQTVLPTTVSIYENGYKKPAMPLVCTDLTEELKTKGVQIIHAHEGESANYIKRYLEPLKMLYHSSESDVFLKMDLDDFYTEKYIENTTGMLGNNDWAINLNSGLVLVRPYAGDFRFRASAVMTYSPVGAAPTHVVFNRKFAEKYLGYLSSNVNTPGISDDELMAECLSNMKVLRVDGPVDYMYVSHGTNQSSSAWQTTGGKIYFED